MAHRSHSKKELQGFWKAFERAGWNVAALTRAEGGAGSTWESRIRRCRTELGVAEPAASQVVKTKVTAVPDAELRRNWDAYAEKGYNEAASAAALGMQRSTLQHRLGMARARLGVQEPPLEIRERQRLQDAADKAKTEVRRLSRELNEAEDLRTAIFNLAAQPLVPPAWTIATPRSHQVPGIPILFASDLQWGERIKASAMDGMNEFNPEVASRRYRLLIEKTLELAFTHMHRPKYDGMIYLRGGDMISGEIHADLRESNDLQSVPAIKDLVEHECAGIEQMLSKFGKVHVASVHGNHGRMTPKPQSKGSMERNLDTLTAWWLESYWKKEKRVSWQTPASGDAMLPVYGFRFLLTHGDRIGSRGGEGFIGAVATITRGMKKVADYYAALGQPLDLQFIGHFHTSLELEYGFANGSLPGYSEYARDLRMRPQPPKQWLVFAHPAHMVGARWPILLEPRPRLQ